MTLLVIFTLATFLTLVIGRGTQYAVFYGARIIIALPLVAMWTMFYIVRFVISLAIWAISPIAKNHMRRLETMVTSAMGNATALIVAIQSGNGAKVAKALYSMDVDITAKNTYRTFAKSIPYSTCANIVRKHGATMPKRDMLALMDVEIHCGDLFTAAYEQAIDNHASAQAIEIAKQAVADYRESIKVDTTPVETIKKTGKVTPYGKPETLEANTTFQFEGGHYRVVNQQVSGQFRINLTRGLKAIKFEGQQFKVGTFTLQCVKFVSDNSFNAIMVENTPAKTIAPIASEKKTRKAKAETVKAETDDSALVAKITMAVLAAMKANS